MTDNQTYVNMKQRALAAEQECERLKKYLAVLESASQDLLDHEKQMIFCGAARYQKGSAVDKMWAKLKKAIDASRKEQKK